MGKRESITAENVGSAVLSQLKTTENAPKGQFRKLKKPGTLKDGTSPPESGRRSIASRGKLNGNTPTSKVVLFAG